MNTENNNQEENSNEIFTTKTSISRIIPLQMEWEPKRDITTHELALCMKYLLRLNAVMPYEINLDDEKYLRHFKITNHN